MALTTAQLAVALRIIGADTETVPAGAAAVITRQASVARALVTAHAPGAPEDVADEAVIRLVGFLFDQSPGMPRANNAMVASGAGAILAPWHVARLILPAGDGDGAAVVALDGAAVVAALTALQGGARLPATAIRDLPSGGAGGGLTADERAVLEAAVVIGDDTPSLSGADLSFATDGGDGRTINLGGITHPQPAAGDVGRILEATAPAVSAWRAKPAAGLDQTAVDARIDALTDPRLDPLEGVADQLRVRQAVSSSAMVNFLVANQGYALGATIPSGNLGDKLHVAINNVWVELDWDWTSGIAKGLPGAQLTDSNSHSWTSAGVTYRLAYGDSDALVGSASTPGNYPVRIFWDRVQTGSGTAPAANRLVPVVGAGDVGRILTAPQSAGGQPTWNSNPGQTAVQVTAAVRAGVADWAEQGNTDDIPLAKLGNAPSGGGGGLSQSQVDARVKAGVLDWAEADDTSRIPESKLPPKVDDFADALSGTGGFVDEGNVALNDAFVSSHYSTVAKPANPEQSPFVYVSSFSSSPRQTNVYAIVRKPVAVPLDELRLAVGSQLESESPVVYPSSGWTLITANDGGYDYYSVQLANVPVTIVRVQRFNAFTLDGPKVGIPSWVTSPSVVIPRAKIPESRFVTELVDQVRGITIARFNGSVRNPLNAFQTPLVLAAGDHGVLLVSIQASVASGSTSQVALGDTVTASMQLYLSMLRASTVDDGSGSNGLMAASFDVHSVSGGTRGAKRGTIVCRIARNASNQVGTYARYDPESGAPGSAAGQIALTWEVTLLRTDASAAAGGGATGRALRFSATRLVNWFSSAAQTHNSIITPSPSMDWPDSGNDLYVMSVYGFNTSQRLWRTGPFPTNRDSGDSQSAIMFENSAGARADVSIEPPAFNRQTFTYTNTIRFRLRGSSALLGSGFKSITVQKLEVQ